MAKRRAIIVDLDGTLALLNGRDPIHEMAKCGSDIPNRPVLEVVRAFARLDYHILIVSGRFERYREATERWLTHHQIPCRQLYLRADGDYRKDADVKREIHENDIAGRYQVLFAMDDRNQSVECWRVMGLPCFQVAPGDF